MSAGRVCARCRQAKPADAFRPDPRRKGGLYPYCQVCAPVVSREGYKRGQMGRRVYVPAEPARRHVAELERAGMTRHQIAEIAGINRTQVRNLMVGQPPRQGPAKNLRPETARAILAVRADACTPAAAASADHRAGATVDATGTRRRLQALAASGWSLRDVAPRLSVLPANLSTLLRRERVTSNTARQVRALYDELEHRPGPSSRAARIARTRGWLAPAWWDADALDDPHAIPEGMLVYDDRGQFVDDHSAWRCDRVARLTARGLTPAQVAEALDVPVRYVHLDLRTLELQGVSA